MKYKLGDKVYHKDVYNYKEQLTVVGIRENQLELEGDFSGGTQPITQVDWLSIEGTSFIYDYQYKKECREYALQIGGSNLAIISENRYNIAMLRLMKMVITLTKNLK